MTKPWTRKDTQIWINQLENRIEDINFYVNHTLHWCDEHYVTDEQPLTACIMVTILWVCMMREETISRREVMELLGIGNWDEVEDFEYMLDDRFKDMELDDVLDEVLEKFSDYE